MSGDQILSLLGRKRHQIDLTGTLLETIIEITEVGMLIVYGLIFNRGNFRIITWPLTVNESNWPFHLISAPRFPQLRKFEF